MAAVGKVRIEIDRTYALSVGVSMAAPYVAETTREILNLATVRAPRKTGTLANAHRMTVRARRTYVAGTVENRTRYFYPVHDGAAPHTIKARRKKALAFYWGRVGMVTIVPKKRTGTGKRKTKKGVRFVIGKGFVKHPGAKARPFLVSALQQVATARGFVVTVGLSGNVSA